MADTLQMSRTGRSWIRCFGNTKQKRCTQLPVQNARSQEGNALIAGAAEETIGSYQVGWWRADVLASRDRLSGAGPKPLQATAIKPKAGVSPGDERKML